MNLKETQVVVLMGGLGTRLSAKIQAPKSMADVCGRPFFHYQMELLRNYGFRNFVFCIGYKGEEIKSYFKGGKRFGVNIRYSVEKKDLLGTAGAVSNALRLLKGDFMLIYGDSYMDIDYNELIYQYFRFKPQRGARGLLSVYKNRNKLDKSNIKFKDGLILKYDKNHRSGQMKYIDYGISIMSKSLAKEIPKGRYSDLSDMYKRWVSQGKLAGYEVRNRFYEIGTPKSLNLFRDFVRRRKIKSNPVIFLDRDGTLNNMVFNENIQQFDSPLKPAELKLLPRAAKALKILKGLGYLLIVVTNQPAAAKGKTTLNEIYGVNNRLRDVLAKNGVFIDDILVCPHHPDGSGLSKERFLIKTCDCRKPKTGLLKLASGKMKIDYGKTYIVGDSYTDIIMGAKYGFKTVFLGNFKCENCQRLGKVKPDFVFSNLFDFARNLKGRNKLKL